MKVTKEHLDLIIQGSSLNKINKITGINKSTLYYHYKKIKGRKYSLVTFSESNPEIIGEFMGIFAGDGNFYFLKDKYRYKITITIGFYEKKYAHILYAFLTRLFSKSPRMYTYPERGIIILEYYSLPIYSLIYKYLKWEENKTKTIRLRDINNQTRDFLKGFLRGLFDTDGGIGLKKRKVAFGTASKLLAFQIKKILKMFDMPPGFYKYRYKDFWYIDLYGKRTTKFMEFIKPRHPNKVIPQL